MTRPEFEKEVLEIADYLGCNGPELLSEISVLVSKLSPTYFDESLLDPQPKLKKAGKE